MVISLSFSSYVFFSVVEFNENSCDVVLSLAIVCIPVPRPASINQFFHPFNHTIHVLGIFLFEALRVNVFEDIIAGLFVCFDVPETVASDQNEGIILIVSIKVPYLRQISHCLFLCR